jgi:hypothetical protein
LHPPGAGAAKSAEAPEEEEPGMGSEHVVWQARSVQATLPPSQLQVLQPSGAGMPRVPSG